MFNPNVSHWIKLFDVVSRKILDYFQLEAFLENWTVGVKTFSLCS